MMSKEEFRGTEEDWDERIACEIFQFKRHGYDAPLTGKCYDAKPERWCPLLASVARNRSEH